MDEEAYDTSEEYCGVRCCKIAEERGMRRGMNQKTLTKTFYPRKLGPAGELVKAVIGAA